MNTMTRLNALARGGDGIMIFATCLVGLSVFLAGAAVGAALRSLAPPAPAVAIDPLAIDPVPLSAMELAGPMLIQETWPIAISLRIVDRATFDAQTDDERVVAFTRFKSPCEIIMPAGWPIAAWPRIGLARWVNRDDGDTLAHEILHCLRGTWHPPWPPPTPEQKPTRKGDKQ